MTLCLTFDDGLKAHADGHEVYPHTHDHVDLAELFVAANFDGRVDEVWA